jgi:hypothetical protein
VGQGVRRGWLLIVPNLLDAATLERRREAVDHTLAIRTNRCHRIGTSLCERSEISETFKGPQVQQDLEHGVQEQRGEAGRTVPSRAMSQEAAETGCSRHSHASAITESTNRSISSS